MDLLAIMEECGALDPDSEGFFTVYRLLLQPMVVATNIQLRNSNKHELDAPAMEVIKRLVQSNNVSDEVAHTAHISRAR